MLIQHFGQHSIDVHGDLGIGLFMKEADEGAVRLVTDLSEYTVELRGRLVEME